MKGFIVIALLCGCAISSPSQTLTVDSLAARVARFGTGLPQEKVYLHIDNTCYFVGDTIRYKGYVMRSDRGTLTDLSKIMYVELLTPDGFLGGTATAGTDGRHGARGVHAHRFALCGIL